MYVPDPPPTPGALPTAYVEFLAGRGLEVPLAARAGAEAIRPLLIGHDDEHPTVTFPTGRPRGLDVILLTEQWPHDVGLAHGAAHLLYLWRPQAQALPGLLQEPGPIVYSWRRVHTEACGALPPTPEKRPHLRVVEP